jgi:hypothetical protein
MSTNCGPTCLRVEDPADLSAAPSPLDYQHLHSQLVGHVRLGPTSSIKSNTHAIQPTKNPPKRVFYSVNLDH